MVCGPRDNPDYLIDPEINFCAKAGCEIEKILAETLYPYVAFPNAFKNANIDNYKAYEQPGRCVKFVNEMTMIRSMTRKKDACCGEYPKRLAYDSGFMECCSDQGAGDIRPRGLC